MSSGSDNRPERVRREESRHAEDHIICQGPSAEQWQHWDQRNNRMGPLVDNPSLPCCPLPSSGSPAQFFFLLKVRGNHVNECGRKTLADLHQHPTKRKGPSLSLLRPGGEEGVDKQTGTKWSALDKYKNGIRMCVRFSYSGRWRMPGIREVPGSHDSG